ncbi:MAG TPA: hypothetical protein VHL11_02600 [Phototrophicaceae bacterium]|jgi:hypothetical protein|nr:hypothetical protein [Phototrophicaceae bacterium]
MNAIVLSDILVHGLMFSVVISAMLLTGLTLNPRLMIQDYPPEVKAKLPPMTPSEKRWQMVMGVPIFGAVIFIMTYSTAQVIARNNGVAEFLPIFINAYAVFWLFNLFDLVVLDYFVLMILKPGFLIPPGGEGVTDMSTFGFHVRGFFIGCLYSGVVALLTTVIALIMT